MLPILFSTFVLINLFLSGSSNNDLNCDFNTACCWKESTPNPFVNDILASDIIDLNWYHRTFKVGKSKPPPAKNYLLRSVASNTTATPIYQSCPFCSENGIVNIEFRHWQSPSTKFYICFKEINKPVEKENCELVNYILQSKLVDVEFEIEKKKKTELVFMISNPSIYSDSIVMIDHINVRTAYCGLNIKTLPKIVKQETKQIKQQNDDVFVAPKIEIPHHLTEVIPAKDEIETITPKKPITQSEGKKILTTQKQVSPEISILNPSENLMAHQIPDNNINSPKKPYQPSQIVGKKTISLTTIPTPVFTFPTLPPSLSALTANGGGIFSLLPTSFQPMTPEFTGFNIKPSKVQKVTTAKVLIPNLEVQKVENDKILDNKKINNLEAKSAPTVTLPIDSKKNKNNDGNPFVEMFGKEFADFLDPAYETNTDEGKDNKINEQNISQNKVNVGTDNGKKQNIQDGVLGIFDPRNQVCNTIGGCLFEKSLCSYHNVPDLANGGEFKIATVGKSRFIEARLNPGQVAVFESNTNMMEDHVVMFDVLEWVEGEKLSGCCIVPNRQPNEMICPYESSLFQGPIEWKGGQMVCPKGTTIIMFICENYGRNKGVCAIDNIRLHKTSDISRSEPCQKEYLMNI
ncbi:Hypothetical protein SRAE_X000203300 [Strongyloides ratti]|uniref:Uncharacterized protein n=1 Tax=Strongyloides ratti TaxID=34506 RepID=A0A090KS20_STRRB|nr:Hypothetical protein SRAE_X000203300 [Strongyloides ratti]CEF60295.1 Hypothetical protein SRAE_X000203300 [Strongyloides ratti]